MVDISKIKTMLDQAEELVDQGKVEETAKLIKEVKVQMRNLIESQYSLIAKIHLKIRVMNALKNMKKTLIKHQEILNKIRKEAVRKGVAPAGYLKEN